MHLKIHLSYLSLLASLTLTPAAAIPVYALKETPTLVFQKTLSNGSNLCVTRKRMPPNPETIARVEQFKEQYKQGRTGLPTNAHFPLTDYSEFYSFVVTRGQDKPETLWSLRTDHYSGPGHNPLLDASIIRVQDATAEAHTLIVVFKQAGETQAGVIQPAPKKTWKVMPNQGATLARDGGPTEGFMQSAKIGGSFFKGTLFVDLTYAGNRVERFLWKDDKWVKQEGNPAAQIKGNDGGSGGTVEPPKVEPMPSKT